MAVAYKIRQVELVGQKIRQLRKDRNITQTELSQRIGIQQSDLSRMEKGEYRVSLDTLFRVLAEFNVGVSEFFEDLNRESYSPREMRLLSDVRALPDEAQREIEEFIAFKRAQKERDLDR
jgi:transcriptional regulator with XRE-family HTH domain